MKRHLYSIITLAVLALPVAFSFEGRVHFWTHWPAAGAALALTGVLYLFWNSLAVRRGDWTFNPKYAGALRLFHLPVGGVLFLVAVPYASLFLFEMVRSSFSSEWWPVARTPLLAGALVFVVAAWLFRHHGFTLITMVSAVIFLSTLALTHPGLAGRSEFWIWLGACFVGLAVVCWLTAALPILWYNPKAFTGLKIGPVPLEDFIYNLSFVGLTLCFYLVFESWFAGQVGL
jgi:lycopene cyclase domain-containing protein